MLLNITVLYAGLLALIGTVLAMVVGSVWVKADMSTGDGGNVPLLQSIRRHANFTEYVSMAIILMAIRELNGANRVLCLMRVVVTFVNYSRFRRSV